MVKRGASGWGGPAFAKVTLVEQYAGKRRQLEAIGATDAQKADVFNHLYAFFARYYDAGDVIPRRFYGSRESYAVPWNGEEILRLSRALATSNSEGSATAPGRQPPATTASAPWRTA
jgi:hypothetical protein